MGCCASAPPPSPGFGQLTIWGDYFNSDTRTIENMVSICGVPNKMNIIDTLNSENKQEGYLKVNPTGTVPTITDIKGNQYVLGGFSIYINYLCNHQQRIKENIYPEEYKKEIDNRILWFQSLVRVNTGRIIKMIISPKVFGDQSPKPDDLEKDINELMTRILPKID